MTVSEQRQILSGNYVVANPTFYKTYEVQVTPFDENLDYFPYAVRVISAVYTPRVVGSDLSAVTATIEKCTGTDAPGAGTSLHASGSFDLKGTVDTAQGAVLSATAATLAFAAGDRLALNVDGTTTAATGILTVGYQTI